MLSITLHVDESVSGSAALATPLRVTICTREDPSNVIASITAPFCQGSTRQHVSACGSRSEVRQIVASSTPNQKAPSASAARVVTVPRESAGVGRSWSVPPASIATNRSRAGSRCAP